MECYATPRPLWRESRNLWHFIEPYECHGKVPSLLRDVRLRGGLKVRCSSALSYINWPLSPVFACLRMKLAQTGVARNER